VPTSTILAPAAETICSTGTSTVVGASVTDGTPIWTHNGLGAFSPGTQNTLSPIYIPVAGDAGTIVTLTMNVSSSNSCSNPPAVTYSVTVEGLPVATILAPASQTICSTGSATVVGATSTNGDPSWTHNGLGSFSPGTASTDSPTYNAVAGDAGNTVVLTLTVTSTNSCASVTDQATYSINVDALPTASIDLPGSQTICSSGSALVSGANAPIGTPSWTITSGLGSISGAGTLTPTYTPVAGDAGNTVTLTLDVLSTNTCPNPPSVDYFVFVDGLPTAAAGGSQTICSSGTATVSGATAANGSILWTVTSGLGTITLGTETTTTPIYNPVVGDEGTTVTLEMIVTSSNSCFPSQSAPAIYSINVIELPTVTFTSGGTTNSQSICLGNPLALDITYSVTGVGSDPSVTGLPPGLAGVFDPITGILTISGTPTQVGTFFYIVTKPGLCGSANAVGSITVNPVLAANSSGSDVVICEGTSTTLVGGPVTGGDETYSYLWESSTTPGGPYAPASGVNNGSNYTTGNLLVDTYFIRTVTSGGCSDVAVEVAVLIDPLPAASAGGTSVICSDETVTVSGALSSNGSILWTHDGAGSISGETTLTPIYTANVADAGNTVILTMTVTGLLTCGTSVVTATYTVNVNPLPTAFAGGSSSICSNDSVTVSGANATNGAILWTHDGAGTISNATTLTPTYVADILDAGNTVILTMTVSSTVPCVPPIAPTAIYTINVFPSPVSVNAGIDDTVSLGSSIQLNATGPSIVTWDWTPSLSLDNPFIYNPEASPTVTTNYVVTATHLNGCLSQDSVTIVVENDFNLVISNALTPNGDGKNDTWNIQNIENYPNTEVIVVNREGQIVFEDQNYLNTWDGKYNGKNLPDATYYYIVKFATSEKVYKGAVTILQGTSK
jgi:gliding motility-associated-like protein